MNDSVGSAIEKIKLLEQDTETKLKEKRESDVTVATLNRTIKETMQLNAKMLAEHAQLTKKIDCLKAELVVEKTRRDALVVQVEVCKKELKTLKNESDQGIAKVWDLRSGLCANVQMVADDCDVRALLIKPVHTEYNPTPAKKNAHENSNETSKIEDRLKVAIERRKQVIAVRDRLQVEPDVGEEYVRIKNALQYSQDMVSKLSQQ